MENIFTVKLGLELSNKGSDLVWGEMSIEEDGLKIFFKNDTIFLTLVDLFGRNRVSQQAYNNELKLKYEDFESIEFAGGFLNLFPYLNIKLRDTEKYDFLLAYLPLKDIEVRYKVKDSIIKLEILRKNTDDIKNLLREKGFRI